MLVVTVLLNLVLVLVGSFRLLPIHRRNLNLSFQADADDLETELQLAVTDGEDDDEGGKAKQTKTMRSKKFHPFPFDYHEELELTIDALSNLGVGIARVPLDGTNWVVMVPLTLPGERVRARVFRNQATYSEADLIDVLVPSPDRVQPPCPYFQLCGGCNYQHVDISAQRAWKQAQVVDLLQRIGGVETIKVNPVVGTSDAYGYRTKITPHYNPPHGKNKELKIGFQQRGTRIVIDIDRCLIATPKINEKYTETRATLATTIVPKNKGATLLFRECEEGVETDPRQVVSQRVGDVTFRFKAGEFFQNNAFILPLLVEHVLKQAAGDGCVHLIDTYCGSGLFAISAANQFQSVFGVEVSELAVRAAIANAELNQLNNVQFMTGVAEEIFSKVQHLDADQTVVIIDPPRKGCDDMFTTQLFQFRPKKLIYVSCDPATQARDTKAIINNGYTIKDCTPFDLFPQTRHIENVLTFIRT